MRRILNVAEKPSAAKQMASVLGRGGARTTFSKSKYNPVYEFKYKFNTQDVLMNFTSVAGHIVSMAFEEQYSMKHWNTAPYEHLFKMAKVLKKVDPDKELLVQNLQNLAKNASAVVLWLDCDREGEAIAYEVLRVCQEVKPDIEVYRAHFSALTEKDITSAMSNLQSPDPNLADAVESRQEIDLRIGAAFTRFQTTFLKKKIPDLASNKVISYGPCQFPTLGFVVERWKKVQNFVPEPFWFIYCKHQKKDNEGNLVNVEFQWDKDHLFDKAETEELYEKCQRKGEAVVKSIVGSDKQKYRPVPLTTVSLQKLAASKLKISSHRLMDIAEKLYNRGFISYPRTETDFFSNTINVRGLLDVQRHHTEWGQYATDLLDKDGFQWPRRGKHDDKAHPPIHPVMMVRKDDPSLTNDEWRVYELVTRHFLACCSKDANGYETVVNIEIGKEAFHAKGLVVKELNWLEIYPYEKWAGNTLPEFKEKERFIPKELKLKDSKTSPPFLLTEHELIGLMDQNGIGTDATIAEHIRTIQERRYAEKKGSFFRPTKLGEALVDAYEATGTDLWKPFFRASMEARMTEISKGNLKKETFLNDCLGEMEEIFLKMRSKEDVILDTMTKHFKGVRLGSSDAETTAIDYDNLDLTEFKVIAENEEGTCGNCNSKSVRVLENADGVRIAHCPVDNLVLKVPKKGDVKFKDATCPLCSFQVLEFKVGAHSKYTVCPWCYTNPPQSLTGEVEENQSLMPCFKCKNKECNLSAAWGNDNTLFGCPKCKSHSMVLRKGKNGKQFFGCKGFPYCKHTISVPDAVKDVEVVAEKCLKCGPDVKKAKVTFTENALLPASIHARLNSEEPHFCFGGCDADLQSLGYQNNLFVTPGANTRTSNKNYYSAAPAANTGAGEAPAQQEGQIKCFKCNQVGHYANKCPNTQGQGGEIPSAPLPKEEKKEPTEAKKTSAKSSPAKENKFVEEKVCPACGQVGRHPNGSTCPSIKKKSAAKEEKPVADTPVKKKTSKKD